MHTGKKIRLLRHLRGLSQGDLSEKINKTRALVSHIEQTGKVNHYTLLTILKSLKVTESYFNTFNEKALSQIAEEKDARPEYGVKELAQLKKQVEEVRKENRMLQEIISYQKKLIRVMESANPTPGSEA